MQSKIAKKVLSGILSVSLMLQMGMPVAFASESNQVQETKTITIFKALAEDVKNITVPMGTLEEELPLPETVTATVERTTYEETTVDSGDAGEAPAAEGTPTTTGQATSLTLGTSSTDSGGTEGAQPKTELVEKKVTEDVNLAVTWESDKPFSSEIADTFTYTAKVTDESYTLGEGVEMPKIMVTVVEMKKTMLLAGNAVASTHTLTVTGGIEGVDYQWGGNIYTLLGEVFKAENVLVILTSKALTITGDTKDQAGYKDVISINNGVTANLMLNGVNLVSSGSSAGITIAPGGALNLTLQGTNTFTQNTGNDFRNCPAIRVPEGASLTVTAESTGSLTSSTFAGSAVIGGSNKEDCGTVTINGGTFDLSATGAINVEYIGGPAIGPGAYASNGTITINGGCIKAYSQWGAAIGSGYNVAMGSLIGQENETIVITGGTVVATTDHAKADGIGGFAKAITGGVTITGGSISTVVQNTRPKSSTQNLYKTTLALDGAGAGVSVSKVSVFLDAGLSETYNTTDMKTDTDGKIYVWLPENAIVTAVIAGGETYTGTVQITTDDSAVGTFIKDAGSYTLTTGVSEHATSTLSKSTGLKEGDTVILYITPDSGYELKGLSLYEGSVPDAPLDTSGFTKISSNTWSFTMPAGNRNLYVNMTEITDTGDFAVNNDTGCSYAYDSTANTLTFSGMGRATVSMKDGVSTTLERIVFGSGAAVTLTISSLNIASAKGIDVSDTAGNCELILEGSNQISAMDSNDAGVHKGNGTGTLTFSGSGSLNVTMNRTGSPYGSAIGGNKDETVQGLIFNGGTITANGITDGAGIGSNPSRSATTSLTINGGIIRGIGGNYANGIGTGFGRPDQITINGGTVYGSGGSSSIDNGGICSGSSTVTITGGSVNMVNLNSNSNNTIFAQPVNTSGTLLYLTTITVGSGENLSKNALVTGLTFQDSYSYGIHDMYTDDSGKLYLWLPVSTVVTGVTTTYGNYTGSCTTNATEQSNHYLKGTAGETFTIQGTYFTKVTDITLSSNPGLGETDLSSIAAVSPANATNSSITWMVMEAGSTGASISNSKLTLSNGGTYKLQAKITNGATPSTDFIKTFTLSVKQPSYMTAAPASVTYGDTLSVPVSFIVSDALEAAVDTGVSGTVKLSKNSDGSSPIATENILDGKGTLVYQTSGKDLAIGDNTLYVVYDGSDTRMTASKMVTVSVKKRPLTVSVTFAEKSYSETKDVKISSAVLSGKLLSDIVTLEDYSSITAATAATEVGTQNVTLSGDFTVSGTDADWYELTQPTGLTIEITKASGTALVTIQDWTYGGSANDPVPMSTTNGTTGVTYQYKVKDAADSTYTATKPTMAGNYTVQATFPETDVYKEVKATADFTIGKSATEFTNGIKTYNGDTETNTFNYGDTIIVKVIPKATGTALTADGLRMLSSFSAPTSNQMALFVGETQITEPKEVISGQELIFTYNTTGTGVIAPDIPVDITAKYVGNDNMADYEQSVKVTVNAVAEVTKGDTTSYAGTLQGAFDLIGSGETGIIKVLKNIDLGSTTNVKQTNGTVTLDLNGKTISAALTDQSKIGVFYINSNSNLTITDSGENGEIRNVASELVLPVIAAFGTFSINDGRLYAKDSRDWCIGGTAVSVYDGTTTITGNACLEGKQYAMQATGGTGNIQGGQLINGIYCGRDVNLNITGGLIKSTNCSIESTGVNDIIIDGGILIGTVFDSNVSTHTGTIIFNSGAIFGDAKEGDWYDPNNWTDMLNVKGWQAKGNITLPISAEILTGKTFTIHDGATVSIGSGATLNNNGTLLLNGTLNGTGALAGIGEFKTTVFTAADIQPIPDQIYTGSAITPDVVADCTILGKEFTVDLAGYTKSYENNIDVGTAKVVFTNTIYANDKVEKTFNIVKSGTTFEGGIKTYKDNAETSIFTYGDTITVKVTPKATGTAPAASGLQAMRSFSAPIVNQMALFAGEKQISNAVTAENGVFTMTYDTANKDITIGDNTITAKYVGNSNMADYSENVIVTLNKKVITSAGVNASDVSASKVYDGTNSFTGVALTTLIGVESSDIVSAIASGTVTDVNVGTDKAITATSVTLDGDHKDYYSLDKGVVSGNVSITQAAATGVNQELQAVKGLAKEYTFELTKLLSALSEGKSFGDITYTVGIVTNNNNVLSQNPANSDIVDGKITLKVANVTDKDKTATVQINVKSTNYKDFTVDLTVKTIDKTPLTIEAVFTGGTYNGKPYAYTGTPTFKKGIEVVPGITYTAKYTGSDGTTYDESEAAPTNAGKYNLILTISGESANTYAGTITIGFEIMKKQITAKPNDASIKSNASFPAYTWSIDTGIAGETITATNAKNVVMEAQENGKRLDAVKVGTFYIVFTTVPAFNQNGDIEKNYDIQISKGKLTVTKHSSGGGSSSGSGSSSSDKDDNDTTVITPPETTENLNPPTKSTATVPSTVTNGTANVTVSQSVVTDAIGRAQAEAKKNGTEKNGIAVVIKVDTKNITASSLSINLSKKAVDALVKAGVKDVCINSGAAIINLNLETLKTIQKEINDDMTISTKKLDNSTLSAKAKAVVGNRPVFDFTITGKNSKKVKDFGKGKVSVSIPYTLGAKEKAGNVVAYYIDNEGKVHEMPNSVYDKQSKTLMFVTNHFSKYAVGYKEDKVTSFTDIANHWAKEVIEFVTARGLFSETEKGKFSPNAVITRGMLVTALGRLAEVDVSSYKTTKFTDVKADSYYLPYIEWASKNGILKGTTETTFAPDQSITREQIAVIMVNYAKVMGFELLQVHKENTFADNAKIGSDAKTAVKQMQMAGVLTGKNSNKFDPQGTATRAEVSALLKRFAELVINRNTKEGWMQNDSGSLLYYKDGKAITGKQSIDGVSYEFNKYGEAILKPSSKDETNTTKNETNTTQKKKPNVVKKPTYRTYNVKKGDSFWSIARKFKVNIYTLAKINKKSIKSTIRPGTVLKIPQK